MKKPIPFLLFLFFSFSLSAQQVVDSLQNILLEKEGVERAEILIQLAKAFERTDSLQSLNYSRQAATIADELGHKDILADSHYLIGETYYYFEKYSQSFSAYQNALYIYTELADSANMAECFNSIGLSYYYRENFEIAIDNFYKSLKIFRQIGSRDEEAHVYSNIAMLYSMIDDHRKSLEIYRLAVEINQSIQDTGSLSVNYNGMGTSYFSLAEYDSSIVFYNKALVLFKKMGNQQRQAIALNNIANIYVSSGDSLYKALDYYQQAIQVFRELNDHRNEAYVMEGLGSVYRELGMYNEALKTFDENIDLVKKAQVGFYLLKLIYNDVSLTYEKMGDIEAAYRSYKLYSQYSDSLLQEERLKQVAELAEKYETEKKETEIERLNALGQVHELQMQRDKQIQTFGFIMIGMLVVLTFFISRAYLNKKKTNQLLSRKNIQIEKQRHELEILNASKNKFFSIIAHDLKNPFHTVMGYSYLMHKEYKRFKDKEREKYAEDIYKSTNTIFRLLQNLLDWSRSQTGRLNFNPQPFAFADLYENIHGLLKPVAVAKKVELLAQIESDVYAYADPMMVETIVRNLVNNAIKFSEEGSTVKTNVLGQNEKLLVCVEDSGVGISSADLDNLFRIDSKVKRKGTNNEDGSGLGLILCKEFVEKNGGSIWAESTLGQGSRFWFTIPVYQKENG